MFTYHYKYKNSSIHLLLQGDQEGDLLRCRVDRFRSLSRGEGEGLRLLDLDLDTDLERPLAAIGDEDRARGSTVLSVAGAVLGVDKRVGTAGGGLLSSGELLCSFTWGEGGWVFSGSTLQ